jgi:hypothetical protein
MASSYPGPQDLASIIAAQADFAFRNHGVTAQSSVNGMFAR